MGKSTERNVAAEQEFAKMAQLLTQTADEAVACLKALKSNLSEYDKRHGLLFLNTARSFMRSDIRAAKDATLELRHVAHRISKSLTLSEEEITAARSKIHEVADALNHLKKKGRAYDRKNHLDEGGLRSSDSIKIESEGSWVSDDSKDISSGSGAADTVENVVRLTLRDKFSGFSALKHQVSVTEDSLSLSFTELVVSTVTSMTNSLKGDAFFEPEVKEKKSMSV
jgi:hypothetical protein